MEDKNINDIVKEVTDTVTEDFVSRLSDEQLDELSKLVAEIKEKLQNM